MSTQAEMTAHLPSCTSAYDVWHAEVAKSSDQEDPLAFAWYRAAASQVQISPRGSLLEVGCGRGGFARYLALTFPELTITALDFSDVAIAIAKEKSSSLSNPPTFVVGDAQNLPFADQSFDWVISCECMEHVPDPQRMACEMFRTLKKEGRFCLTTENYCNGMLIAWAYSWLTGRPFDSGSGVQPLENFFLFWMVDRYLRKAGLKVDGTESCHYQWLLLPRVDPAKLSTERFESRWARRLARPFGRHYTYFGRRAKG
jgi:ubiquinone/menaquinone biosynthesis C-methylase UbiE